MDIPYSDFVAAFDDKNQQWITATRGLSKRLVCDLLTWTGQELADYYDGHRPDSTAGGIWAGGEVPVWLGVGRDFTERWVHHQQIRDAVTQPANTVGAPVWDAL